MKKLKTFFVIKIPSEKRSAMLFKLHFQLPLLEIVHKASYIFYVQWQHSDAYHFNNLHILLGNSFWTYKRKILSPLPQPLTFYNLRQLTSEISPSSHLNFMAFPRHKLIKFSFNLFWLTKCTDFPNSRSWTSIYIYILFLKLTFKFSEKWLCSNDFYPILQKICISLICITLSPAKGHCPSY